MKLKQLKMSGFKSFVEPSTVVFKSNITGVVGPNGCGKSNIIDAVKWVLGESSAKNLRSDGIVNVIFNGSTSRKPAGQASVELLFDNSNGRLTGEYHSYSEISIKRVMSADGNSTYYLNSTKCRRKDITDIFLGTGLGPRSYSIIEQGIISKFVEAKPEDLRIYIEEAAGISKYKERRKETNSKIKSTQDNLSRINDLKEELSRQLEKIKKQANTAEKYKLLKEEEHELRLRLLSLRWCVTNKSLDEIEKKLNENSLELESTKTSKENISKDLVYYREQTQELQSEQYIVQEEHYKVNSEITKKEQSLKYNEERKTQILLDLELIQKEISNYQSEIDEDTKNMNILKKELEEIKTEGLSPEYDFEEIKKLYQSMEHQKQALEEKLSNVADQIVHFEKIISLEEERLNQLGSKKQLIEAQRHKLLDELDSIDLEQIAKDKNMLSASLTETEKNFSRSKQNFEDIQKFLVDSENKQDKVLKQEKQTFHQLQDLNIEFATLEAEQKTNNTNCSENIDKWLQDSGYEQNSLLRETVQAIPGWEMALEVVLGDKLQAICLEKIMDSIQYLDNFKGNIALLSTVPISKNGNKEKLTPLSTKIINPNSMVLGLLDRIYVVDSLNVALDILPTIAADESLVTKDGVWIHKNYIKVVRPTDNKNSVIVRQTRIDEKKGKIIKLQNTIKELSSEKEKLIIQIRETKNTFDKYGREKNDIYQQRVSVEAKLQNKVSELDNFEKKQLQIRDSLKEIDEQLGHLSNDSDKANRSLISSQEQLAPLLDTKIAIQKEKTEFDEEFVQIRQQSEEAVELQYQYNLKEQALITELKGLERNIDRLQNLLNKTKEKDLSTKSELATESVNNTLEEELERCLNKKIEIEDKLGSIQSKIADLNDVIVECDAKRTGVENNLNNFSNISHQISIELEGHRVKKVSIEEQVSELDIKISDLKEYLTEGLVEEDVSNELHNIIRRIERLGPINLTAIDEYNSEKERYEYYVKQSDDLSEALDILIGAIKKIDLETKNRFKSTYSAINDSFKEIFPKLFGGGKAELYLTEKNLLDTGIGIIAKPPGKKIANIAALSGGEKAMTAVAMVLSIFKLNPSPFCMLDEVDAPLDDANVLRFCEVIKDMSKSVQFIVITHNKLTMEMTEQLSGVTMQEPGVSRLVSVDIEEIIDAA